MQLALPDPENWYPEPECILPNWQTFFFSQASPIPSLSQTDIGTFGLHNFNLIDGISPSREVSPVPSLSSFGSDQSYIKEEDEYQNQTMPAWNYASSPNTGFNSAHGIVALANMLAGNTAFDNNVPPQQTQVTYFSDGPIYDDPDMIHHQYGENELDLVINGLLSHMSAEARNSANEIMVKHPEISKEILCYFFHPPCKKNKLKRNEYASMMRDFSIPYKDIIAVGKLGIAESTLRGAVMKYDLPYNVKELQVYNYAAALYQAVYDAQKRQGIHFTVYNGIDWAWVAWRMWDLMDQQGFKFSANAAKHRWAVEVCKHPGEL